MKSDLLEKLKNDLIKSGLGSELEALKIFESRGWSARGNTAYFDRDEGKSREIDICAHKVSDSDVNGKRIIDSAFQIHAEVKKSKTPWVVFKKPIDKYELCAWNNIIDYVNLPCEPSQLVDYMSSYSLIMVNGWVGTGIHEAFKNPDQPSRWYHAFTSALKASEEYYETYKTEGDKKADDVFNNPTEITLFQPVVILDGILVSAELSEDNDIVIEEITSAAFSFEYKSRNYDRLSYRIDLVTVEGLYEYLAVQEKRHNSIELGLKLAAGIDV